jgi:hypothetical protein
MTFFVGRREYAGFICFTGAPHMNDTMDDNTIIFQLLIETPLRNFF